MDLVSFFVWEALVRGGLQIFGFILYLFLYGI